MEFSKAALASVGSRQGESVSWTLVWVSNVGQMRGMERDGRYRPHAPAAKPAVHAAVHRQRGTSVERCTFCTFGADCRRQGCCWPTLTKKGSGAGCRRSEKSPI